MIDDPVLLNDWHPVASLEQFRRTSILAMRLLGQDLVIWYDQNQYFAWQDLCVHRGAKLSLGKVTEGCLQCPYHGWTYNSHAQCVRIPAHPEQIPPARAVVKTFKLELGYGLIWVCLGEPANGIPEFPEWDDARMGKAVCGPYPHLRANAPRLIENFLDAAHFPFVHEGVLGDPNQPTLGDFETRVTARGVESDPIRVYQPDPYGGTSGQVTYTYHAFRPFTAHFTKHMPQATNGLLLTVTPHDELDSTAWFIVATTALTDNEQLRLEYTPRITEIFEQDRLIVESQRPELLPLDLQTELHLRSDRMAIAYRQWLKDLGLKFGVS